jgi:glutamate-1-semialdehyde 2,1-aminomutase
MGFHLPASRVKFVENFPWTNLRSQPVDKQGVTVKDQNLQVILEQQIAEYMDNNPRSQEMYRRAQGSLPGGNTRTGVFFDPFPIYADRGEGVHLFDIDGHKLLDFVNNNTALILGHAHPDVVRALQDRIALGTGFSRPLVLEVEMAELLRERMPSLERLRFCSSGTEAVLNAIRASRAFTGKSRIAKFEGAYHGMDEYVMVSHVPPIGPDLGPKNRPGSVPTSAGLTPEAIQNVIVLPFNDPESCEQIIRENRNELAAVIVDPISTAAGLTLPANDFLKHLRKITEAHGILLIFDEIISYRISSGGAQEHYDVRPDLTCMGKVVAGGTPGAVVGGRADILSLYDPSAGAPQIPHSGTYNANPLAMVAGLTTLRLLTPDAYLKLETLTARLGSRLSETFSSAGIEASVTTIGSLFRLHFLPSSPLNYRQAALDNAVMHKWLFFSLLNKGIYWKLGGNVSLPMGEAHIEHLVGTLSKLLADQQ